MKTSSQIILAQSTVIDRYRAALEEIAYYGESIPLEMPEAAYFHHCARDMRRIAHAALNPEDVQK